MTRQTKLGLRSFSEEPAEGTTRSGWEDFMGDEENSLEAKGFIPRRSDNLPIVRLFRWDLDTPNTAVDYNKNAMPGANLSTSEANSIIVQ